MAVVCRPRLELLSSNCEKKHLNCGFGMLLNIWPGNYMYKKGLANINKYLNLNSRPLNKHWHCDPRLFSSALVSTNGDNLGCNRILCNSLMVLICSIVILHQVGVSVILMVFLLHFRVRRLSRFLPKG